MKEALGAVLVYAKHLLRLVELHADIDELNARSVHLLLALGFQRVSATKYERKL